MSDFKNILNYSTAFLPSNRVADSAWAEHVPFAMFLVDLVRPNVIVELGTHYGVSYCAFCQAVKYLKLDSRCYAVDSWKGDSQSGFYNQDVLDDLKSHHDPLYSDFSTLIQSSFDKAVSKFEDRSIDLLHIDGYHTYEAVKHDFETWLPKVSTRGIVLFHDTNVKSDDFGVWKLWEELKNQYPNFEFLHGHGLGLIAVGNNFPHVLDEVFNAPTTIKENMRAMFHRLGVAVDLTYRLTNTEATLAETREVFSEVLEKTQAELAKTQANLTQTNAQLTMIQGSTAWHIVQFLWRIRIVLAPHGSKRERFGQFIIAGIRSLRRVIARFFLRESKKHQPLGEILHDDIPNIHEKNIQSVRREPIIVHQMGKVGSKTIEVSLNEAYRALGIHVPVYHIHILNDFDALEKQALQERPAPEDFIAAVDQGRDLRKLIDEDTTQHWNIISLVREPIARNVGTFFHNLPDFIPDWQGRYMRGALSVNALQDLFFQVCSINDWPEYWFDAQIKPIPAIGIDVYAEPFPHTLGYKIYSESSRSRLLVIRLENLNKCAGKAIGEFLGLENFVLHNANIGDKKEYAELYRAFKELPLPMEYVKRIYSTKYARHFYTVTEIDSFIAHWTQSDSLDGESM